MNSRSTRSVKKRGKRKAVLTLFILLFSASLCFGAYMLARRTVSVSEISFRGNKYTKSRDLASLIGVRKGDELLSLSSREIHDRLKKGSPWVKDAVIRMEPLSLTSGRLEILVTEAVPVAVLRRGQRSFLIDGDGVLLEEMREGTSLFLPVIQDIDPVRERDAYREAINCVMVLHKRRVGAYSGDLVVTGKRPEEIALLVDNITVKIGAGDLEKKLDRLAFVRGEIQKRSMEVESIDLRFAGRIIVRPAVQEPPAKPQVVAGKPEAAKEAPKKPEPGKKTPERAEAKKPQVKRPEAKKADTKKVETKKSEAKKADTETKRAVAKIAAAKKAEAKKEPKKSAKKTVKKQAEKEPEKRQQR